MRNARNTVTLLLALLLATAAAAGVYVYANPASDGGAETALLAPTAVSTATPVLTTPVLVTLQDVAANTSVTAEMVEVRQVAPADKNSRALAAPEEAIGMVTTVALVQGEQVLASRLTAEPSTGVVANTFAYEVPAGKRAFAVVFDEVIGAGALVQPGDRVDVIAYFEIDVTDPGFEQTNQSAARREHSDADDDEGDDDEDGNEDDVDYTQYVASYIVQDVEVLAVAQALSPDEIGVAGVGASLPPTPIPTPTLAPEEGNDDAPVPAVPTAVPADPPGDPVARPTALSVTLAVSPEQAQRLLLAALTVEKEKGGLRLSLRSPGDTTTFDLRPAQLGEIPLGGILGDVNRPMIPSELVITEAEFSRRVLSAGEFLEFTVTVKNTSVDTTVSADTSVPSGFTYTQGTAYDALGFYPDSNSYRIGLNVSGAYPTQYPYRWSLGRDLKPGESIKISGSIKMTDPTPGTRYWFGVILEPNTVSQDGIGVADITVLPAAAAVVSDRRAELRAEPNNGGAVTAELARGDYLRILEPRGDWFLVETADQTEGWIAVASVDIVPPVPSGVATPGSPRNDSTTPTSATPASS